MQGPRPPLALISARFLVKGPLCPQTSFPANSDWTVWEPRTPRWQIQDPGKPATGGLSLLCMGTGARCLGIPGVACHRGPLTPITYGAGSVMPLLRNV